MFFANFETYYVIARKVADLPHSSKKRPIDPIPRKTAITYHVPIREIIRDYNDRRVTRISKANGLFESTYNAKCLMKF